ncbi:MAG: sporulation protein YqfC [Firmicutes bacterium]|jgi:sporulation protein YqfC|nr:sporulation protein YqfC [Bacillota bacterium]
MTDVLELPKDLVLNLPRITMVGNIQLTIENHRGVILYSDRRIRVAVSRGEFIIEGQKLTLRSILPDAIIIDGTITGISYIG